MLLVVLLVCVAALVVRVETQSPASSQTSPSSANPAGLPSADRVSADRKSTAPIGPNPNTVSISDRETASRHFREEKQCLIVAKAIELYRSRLRACEDPQWMPGPEKEAACAKQTAGDIEKIAALTPQWNECGANSHGIEQEYETATRMAAHLGDMDAQLCWFPPPDAEYHVSEDDRTTALKYYDQALKRGDWRFVEQGAETNFLTMLTYSAGHDDDPAEGELASYRMRRLLRTGATGPYAQWLDGTSTTAYLSDEQKAAAEAWAREEYAAFFASQPKLTEVPDSCADLINGRGDLYKHPWRNGMMQ